MSPALLMIVASLLFATMGVAVKLASAQYGAGEIVMYRGAFGALAIGALSRLRGVPLATPVPAMHCWRSAVGVAALVLWFYSLGGLPLATAVTLNYLSSVWMAMFVMGGAVLLGAERGRGRRDARGIDARIVATVLLGFVGVACILRPTIERDQLWHGLMGLLSGLLAALAYLQIAALGRAGEPESRVVFYFSLGSIVAGAAITLLGGGFARHTPLGLALLLAVGATATVAQMCMTRAYTIGRPLVNASLQYLGIAFSFGFGVLLFDDPVTPLSIAGMLLVVGAGIGATRARQTVAAPDPRHPGPQP